jgi:copper resistance protein D
MADPLIFVRGVHFAATLLACGTVGFIGLAVVPAAKQPASFAAFRERLTILVWLALAVAILSGAAWLLLLAAEILGAPILDVCLQGGAWPVLFDTRFGLVWCVRLVLAVLLGLMMFRPALSGPALATAAALVMLPALVGHAGATPGIAGDIHLLFDMAHLLAAGAWLGGLPAFCLALTSARNEPGWDNFIAGTTRRFSIIGILSVATLLASGLVNAWNLLGGPRDLVTTGYGRLIALKIGLFVAMLAIAAVNRFYLTPRLPERGALRALRRNSLAEILLGICVLVLVGMLGTRAPTAHKHAQPEGIPDSAAFVHIHAPEAMADVTIDPGRAGPAEATIRVMREDLSLFPAKDVRLTLEPPSKRTPPLRQNAIEQTNGVWRVTGIALSEPGIWTVRVVVTSSVGEAIELDAPIVIER